MLFVATSALLLIASVATAKPFSRPLRELQLSPKVDWLDCATNVPLNIQGILNITSYDNTTAAELGPLPSSLQCGSIQVPMDYARPMCEDNKITVSFSRISASSGPSKGTVYFNPGGPGPAVQWLAWIVALNLSSDAAAFSGLEEYDLLFPDIRGTGASNLLNCSIDLYNTVNGPHPESEAEFEVLQQHSAAFAAYCDENTTPKGFIKYASAFEAMHDWDQIRIALGLDKINLVGLSYGTYYGPQYARLFPEHVGRFALDAVFPTGQADIEVIALESLAFTRGFDRMDAFCLEEPSCPFYGQGKGSVQAALAKLLNSTSEPGSNLTKYDVQSGIFNTFFDDATNFTEISLTLYAAANGDISALAPVPITQEQTNSVLLNCPDQRIDNNTFAGHQAIRAAMAKNDPYHFDSSELLTALEYCSGWPYPGRPKVDFHSDLPVLYVAADFDVVCAQEHSSYMKARSPKSTLIIRHGDGHGTFEDTGLLARDLELAYLTTGQVPNSSNTTLATVYRPGANILPAPVPAPYSILVGELASDL